jgi:hypothetical protein
LPKNSEYAKKLESILILVMEIVFPNKNSQFVEKLNLQNSNTTNALPVNDFNVLKAAEKNDNLIVLRSFFEKLMEQPKPLDISKAKKSVDSALALNNCLMLANANKSQYNYDLNGNNNIMLPSNTSNISSNHSQVSQLINNIEEGLDSKRKLSSPSPFNDEGGLFGAGPCNSPYISRVECSYS